MRELSKESTKRAIQRRAATVGDFASKAHTSPLENFLFVRSLGHRLTVLVWEGDYFQPLNLSGYFPEGSDIHGKEIFLVGTTSRLARVHQGQISHYVPSCLCPILRHLLFYENSYIYIYACLLHVPYTCDTSFIYIYIYNDTI